MRIENRTIDEIHVEQIHESHQKLVELCKIKPNAILMLCVCMKHWKEGKGKFKRTYPCYADNEEVKKYYVSLKRQVFNPFGLHVHISKSINEVSYEKQRRLIKFGKDLLENVGIRTEEFVSGWWMYNEDTYLACKSLSFNKIHAHPVISKCIRVKGVQTIFVKRKNVIHDYEVLR